MDRFCYECPAIAASSSANSNGLDAMKLYSALVLQSDSKGYRMLCLGRCDSMEMECRQSFLDPPGISVRLRKLQVTVNGSGIGGGYVLDLPGGSRFSVLLLAVTPPPPPRVEESHGFYRISAHS